MASLVSACLSSSRSPTPESDESPPWHHTKLDPPTKQAAQTIHQAYQLTGDEVGCCTRGHAGTSTTDRELAFRHGSNLLYGEVLPHGVTRMCDQQHLNAHDNNVKQVYDLGSGCGKLIMQIFLQFPHIKHCVGVELAMSRVDQAINATVELAKIRQNQGYDVAVHRESGAVELIETLKSSKLTRHLSYRFQSLFDAVDAWDADILVVEVKIDPAVYGALCRFLSHCKVGCRLLTYENINELHTISGVTNTWQQLSMNMNFSDRFYTSWATHSGHHFYLYSRLYPHGIMELDEKEQKQQTK